MQKEKPDNSHHCHSSSSWSDIFPTLKIYIFIYLWQCWVSVAACRFSLGCSEQGLLFLHCTTQASNGGGFPCWRAWGALQHVGSRAPGHGAEGSREWGLQGMWALGLQGAWAPGCWGWALQGAGSPGLEGVGALGLEGAWAPGLQGAWAQ